MYHDVHGAVAYLWYPISMFATSILCGIISTYFLYQFRSYSSYHFIKLRRRTLIFLYSIATIFALIVLCPINVYLTACIFIHTEPVFFQIWLIYLAQEFVIASMLILIAARCWLLYYDHSYNVSLVDLNWKGEISNEKNFWLKHRKTWGDITFILCAAISIAVVVLIALCSVSIHILHTEDAEALHLVNLILIVIPCSVFLCFIIYSHRFKNVFSYDEFMIIQEIQYLAICILLLLIIYIVDLYHISIVHQSGHMLFCFTTNFVQTRWVVKQFIAQNEMLLNKQKVLKAPNAKNSPNLTMSQVLKHKDGFTMFMRHCQHELNVEGLLFICEVAQYKVKLHELIHKMDTNATHSQSTQNMRKESTSDFNSSHRKSDIKQLPPLNTINQRMSQKHVMDVDIFVQQDWMPIAKQLFISPNASDEIKIQVSCTDEADEKTNYEEDELLYGYAQYLFLKYIDVESDFTINVSYSVRKEMLLFFSKDKEKGFEFILQSNNNDESNSEAALSARDRSLTIKHHLYGVFDNALNEIWKLLSSDTYFRFLHTKQYQYLLKKVKAISK